MAYGNNNVTTVCARPPDSNTINVAARWNFRYTMDMAKTLAVLFGIVFLLIGILGFVPALAPNEMLLNIFHVNAAHNVVHLLTGVVALLAGMAGVGAAKTFFKIFGVVYGLVAVLGFVVGDGLLLGLISNNMAVTWLHVAIAVVSLIIGFAPSGGTTAPTTV
jgi:Domain of unknown function (DUF4383)